MTENSISMKTPNLVGLRGFLNPFVKSLDGNDAFVGSRFSDWRITVSRDRQVLDVKQMTTDMPDTRLRPIFSDAGELTIVILAESKRAAENRGIRIASRIADAGLWGLDFLDLINLEFDK